MRSMSRPLIYVDQILPHRMKAEPALLHFSERFLLAPALDGDAIDRAHGPCAVGAMLAVHQDRHTLGVVHDAQKTNDIFFLGVPGLHRDVFVVDGRFAYHFRIRVERAEIDHGLDAQRARFWIPSAVGWAQRYRSLDTLCKLGSPDTCSGCARSRDVEQTRERRPPLNV